MIVLTCFKASGLIDYNRRPTDIVIDDSGFKVYGKGKWKVKMHGKDRPRR